MWNETTMDNGAGGWAAGGETSFMTDRKPDSKTATLADRLPVPATITMLNEHFSNQDDKYVLGGFRFATVQTVGIVKDIQESESSYTYVLCDPSNNDMEFRASKYSGDNSPTFDPSAIVEGTRVRAIGKLKAFDGVTSIMSFTINPIENEKDFNIFELEAEAARIFFIKNMNDKLRSEHTSSGFKGMLAPPKSRTPAVSQQNSAGSDTKDRIYPVKQQPQMKEDDLRTRVTDVLKAVPQDSRELGSSIKWISEQVNEKDLNKLRTILSDLIDNGEAYTTVDEDSYSVI